MPPIPTGNEATARVAAAIDRSTRKTARHVGVLLKDIEVSTPVFLLADNLSSVRFVLKAGHSPSIFPRILLTAAAQPSLQIRSNK